MIIENTTDNREISKVISTMAIVKEEFVNELIKVGKGKKQ